MGSAHVLLAFLTQRVLARGLESLLDVDGLLGRGLEIRDVSLGLTPSHRTLLRDLSSSKEAEMSWSMRVSVWGETYHALALFHVNLVPNNDERKVFRVSWRGLHSTKRSESQL